MSDLHDIYQALVFFANQADRAWDRARTADQFDRAKALQDTAARGLAAYRRMEEVYRAGVTAKADQARAYDAYVTAPTEGCSCHISPPCAFCIEQSQAEEAAP